MPDDKCTNQCQLHHDMKELLDRHDKVLYGEGVDKEGVLTKISSLWTVRTLVYACIAIVLSGFVAGLVGIVWKGAK